MEDEIVVFKGSVNGLTIIFKEEEPFESLLNHIEKKIISAGKFFKDTAIDVKYRGKKLTEDEEKEVFNLLSSKSGAEIKSISEDQTSNNDQMKCKNSNSSNKLKISNYFFKDLEEGMTKFHRGTVRSGQQVSFYGNVVIIGDVNPGGEVVARGNVIVMGSLRGIVHAGADGNKDAVVVALNLQPTQLRIADVITRSPDEKDMKNQIIPEIAYVKDETVYIENYLPQR